jgi:hypothetical protein
MVKRGTPLKISIPMKLNSRPTTAMLKDLNIDPWARKVRIERPRHIREKNSGGPNFKAVLANG